MPALKSGALSSGAGLAGKDYETRMLANKLRNLTIEKCLKILEGKKTQLQDQLLLKLATVALPRLNEHSGEGGGPIPISLVKLFDQTDVDGSTAVPPVPTESN